MRLAVELYGTQIGKLEGDARTFDFIPSAQGIERFGAASTVLSVAIPLTSTQPRHHARRRRNWFTELLPEGDLYDYMLAQGSLARGDTLGFLARYGRDVAGALRGHELADAARRAACRRDTRVATGCCMPGGPIGGRLSRPPR